MLLSHNTQGWVSLVMLVMEMLPVKAGYMVLLMIQSCTIFLLHWREIRENQAFTIESPFGSALELLLVRKE